MAAQPEPEPGVHPDSGPVERVIVPLDGNERAEKLLQAVVPFAARLQAELTLIHVLLPSDQPTRSPDQISYPDTIHDRAMTLAGDYLTEVSRSLVQSQVQVKTIAAAGETSEMILAHAEQGPPGMVAVSIRERSLFQRWMGQSVAETVWRRGRVPVFAVNAGNLKDLAENAVLPDGILIALDGSKRDRTALAFARRLAARMGLRLTLFGGAIGRRLAKGLPRNGVSSEAGMGAYLEELAEELRTDGVEIAGIADYAPLDEALQAMSLQIVVISPPRRRRVTRKAARTPLMDVTQSSAGPVILVPPERRPPPEEP